MMKRLLASLAFGSMALGAIAITHLGKVSATDGGRTFYVDVAVRASGDGSSWNTAFKTIKEAADIVRAGDTVEIAGGNYRESVTINTKGTNDKKILFKAKSGNAEDKVTISGTEEINATWTVDEKRTASSKSGKVTGNVWVADIKMPLGGGNQLFVNGRMQFVAQWPDRAGEGNSLNKEKLSDLFMKQVFSQTQEGSGPKVVMDSILPAGLDLTKAVFNYKGTSEWRGWQGTVTGTIAGGFTLEKDASPNKYEQVKKDKKYYVCNALDLLNVPGEWYYDEGTSKLYLCLDKGENPNKMKLEMKARTNGLEFTNTAAYVTFENVDLFGANLTFQYNASNCTVDRMEAFYLNYHQDGSAAVSAIQMSGNNNAIWNSEIAYTCRGGVTTYGTGNMVVNCYVHDIDYSITGASAFSPYGEEAVFYHNTAHNVSRSMIGGNGQSGRIAYNHFYDCGMLTNDCGMIYFGTADGGGMEIDHNIVHDNWSSDNAMGIYFDCGVQNYTIHHNVMYNIKTYGLSFNVPSPTMLVFNNTIYDTCGSMNDWGWATLPDYKNNQNGTYVMNNILDWTHYKGNKSPMLFTLSPTSIVKTQIISDVDKKSTDLFKNPDKHDFTLLPMDDPKATERTRMAHSGGTPIKGLIDEGNAYIGAFNPQASRVWKAGCTTDEAGNPAPTNKPLERTRTIFVDESGDTAIILTKPQTDIQYMNRVYNSSFEKETRGWKKEGAQTVSPIATNSSPMLYGKGENAGKENVHSARHSVRLGSNKDDGISQHIEGLKPNTRYVVSAWAQIQEGQEMAIGIRNSDTGKADKDKDVEIRTADTNGGIWKRHYFYFTTEDNTAATVYVKTLKDTAFVSVDDVVVQEYTGDLK